MSMFMQQAMRGYALGAKYGVMDGFRRFNETTETPKMDETAMQGAIGIIIAVGGVLIALYIIAVVVGSISYAVTSGNIRLSPTWNSTISKDVISRKGIFKIACKNGRSQKNAEMRSKLQTDGYTSENIDSQAQATFNLANCIKVQLIKTVRACTRKRVADSDYRGGYPYDRHWCILRSRHLNQVLGYERIESSIQSPNLCRTLNMVAT
jgi:hypothetical protein